MMDPLLPGAAPHVGGNPGDKEKYRDAEQSGDAMQWHLAWQRAMEQALCNNWFPAQAQHTPRASEQADTSYALREARYGDSRAHGPRQVLVSDLCGKASIMERSPQVSGNNDSCPRDTESMVTGGGIRSHVGQGGVPDPHAKPWPAEQVLDLASPHKVAPEAGTGMRSQNTGMILRAALEGWLNAAVVPTGTYGGNDDCMFFSSVVDIPSEANSLAGAEGRATDAAQAQAQRVPVRMHAEWADAGLRLWIGADAGHTAALLQMSTPLVRQLQDWLALQGSRLLALVCNGRTVWLDQACEHIGQVEVRTGYSERQQVSDTASRDDLPSVFFSLLFHSKDAS